MHLAIPLVPQLAQRLRTHPTPQALSGAGQAEERLLPRHARHTIDRHDGGNCAPMARDDGRAPSLGLGQQGRQLIAGIFDTPAARTRHIATVQTERTTVTWSGSLKPMRN